MRLDGERLAQAREKMERIIEQGREKAMQSLNSIVAEYEVRNDMLVPAQGIRYDDLDTGRIRVDSNPLELTGHSLNQLLGRVGMPKTYYNTLTDERQGWATDLLKTNLRTLTDNVLGDDRLLFRVVGGVAKGVLSSAYRRIDASPVFQSFLMEGMNAGLVPADGANTSTRYHVKLLHPAVYEPVEGEVVAYGLSLTTSDYGAGALDLQMFIMRVWCANGAIGDSMLRKVHMGRRVSEEDNSLLSQRTYDLDTQTVASAVKDLVGIGFQSKVDETNALIVKASEKDVDVAKAIDKLRTKGVFTKEDGQTAKALYENVTEVTMLPQQSGAWRWGNVLSLMANSKDIDADKALDLQVESALALK